MRVAEYCHKILEIALPKEMHNKTAEQITRVIESMIKNEGKLSVTSIGESLIGQTDRKHKIKAADRYVGNSKILKHKNSIFKNLANFYFKEAEELFVNVDWSGACLEDHHILQASVVCDGRSIPIYYEVYTEDDYEKHSTHIEFLKNLEEVLSDFENVIIITDAGFHRNWFLEILKNGWDCVGRIFTCYHYKKEHETEWRKLSDINFHGYRNAVAHGEFQLGKWYESVTGYLYTYKEPVSKKGHKKNRYPDHEKQHSRSHRNGWILFSTLNKPAEEIVEFYRKRMQIEQNFRDIKSENYGLGYSRNRSSTKDRIDVLYLTATLLTSFLWWIGAAAEAKKQHYSYQANTIKNKRVISLVNLGRMILNNVNAVISWESILSIRRAIASHYHDFVVHGLGGVLAIKCGDL